MVPAHVLEGGSMAGRIRTWLFRVSSAAVGMAAATALALSLMVLTGVRPANAAFPGNNGKIAFQSDRDVAAGEIYSITPGGSPSRLTFSNGSADPAYSPDARGSRSSRAS